ncbi:VanZ family protein [Clostridium hydrogeniformans]|uniref:VanZ family protein n=1 Tax=Clostridium hydrogeniformans TaxID=349933 RepID=UPI0004813ACF|nr:VanZ family protein [Clostridium hydrogeniformans]
MEKRKSGKLKIFLWTLFIIYLIILVNLILFKNGNALLMTRYMRNLSIIDKLKLINLTPFKMISEFCTGGLSKHIIVENILGNIVAFGPLGFLLPLLFTGIKKLKNVVIIGFMVSLFLEITQLVFLLGSCDIDDIILNTLGAIIGFLVFFYLNKYRKYYTKKVLNTY